MKKKKLKYKNVLYLLYDTSIKKQYEDGDEEVDHEKHEDAVLYGHDSCWICHYDDELL
jgi:hypothetical protein